MTSTNEDISSPFDETVPKGHKLITRGRIKSGDLAKHSGSQSWREIFPQSKEYGQKITDVTGIIARPQKDYKNKNLTYEKRYAYVAEVVQQYKDTATIKLTCDGEILGTLRGSSNKMLSLLTLFNSRANNLHEPLIEFYNVSFTHVMVRDKNA